MFSLPKISPQFSRQFYGKKTHSHDGPHPSRDINFLADMSNTSFVIHMVLINSMPILRKSQSSTILNEFQIPETTNTKFKI